MSFPYSHILSLSEEEAERGQLYLSGVGMLARGELLEALRVGAVLSVMDGWAYAHYKVKAKMQHLQLVHKWLVIEDDEDASILPLIPQTNAFLASELSKHNVLVHCQAGVSRSPSVVIAFLMNHMGLSYSDAKKYVKKKRTCIEPNKRFQNDLMTLSNKQSEKKEQS